MPDEKPIIGVAWYDEAQWYLLTGVVPDRNDLDKTFEDWERAALQGIRMLEAQGFVVKRITVDVGALCSWCRERNLPINGAARVQYITSLLEYTGSGA